MSGFWSASWNKSIRDAYGQDSPYEPPTDHDVNSYRDYNYGPFQGHEPQYANPYNYSPMYQPSQPNMHVCTFCGGLDHPDKYCYILHDYRQFRESHENPNYEMPKNCEAGSHWDHNQSFEGCDQSFINPNDHAHMYQSPQFEHEEFCTPMNLDSTTEAFRLSEQNFDRSTSRIQACLDQILLHLQKEEIHEEMYVVPNEVSSLIHLSDVEYEPNLEEHELT